MIAHIVQKSKVIFSQFFSNKEAEPDDRGLPLFLLIDVDCQ